MSRLDIENCGKLLEKITDSKRKIFKDIKKDIKEFKVAPVASVEANSPIGLNRSCIQGTMTERSRLNNVQLVLFKS